MILPSEIGVNNFYEALQARNIKAYRTAQMALIRKILQPNQIFSIIRRILTQTKPAKRNCYGHEPNPIPTRLVLA
jgi:hypothetical protein